MAKGELLGRIDCPCCGTKNGMRVTEDKNAQPFGYCDATCNVQLRLGGTSYRVEKFYERYPHVRRAGSVTVPYTEGEGEKEKPVTVTDGNAKGKGKTAAPSYLELLGVRA